MSSEIDNRVVSLQFDNASFEKGIAQSLNSIDRMNQGIATMGGASYAPMLQGLQTGLDNLNRKFSTLGIVGMTVINKLTNAAINFGTKTMSQILTGGKTRALTMEHANFMLEGLAKDGKQVEAIMKAANDAVLGTAYGLDEAANAAAQLYASGVKDSKEMYTQLRAIAGVSAMTGKSYTMMADVFTTAAAKGKVQQEELTRLAEQGLAAGEILRDYLKMGKEEFDDKIGKGEISYKQFAKAMDEAFGEHAQDANKTYAGSLDNIHAALKRIGAMFWTPILEDMRDMFNVLLPLLKKFQEGISKTFQPTITKNISNFLDFFTHRLAVAEPAVNGFVNILEALLSVLRPIKQAFFEVFPKITVKQVKNAVKSFEEMTSKLKLTEKQAEAVKDVFVTVFSALKLVLTVILGIGKLITTVIAVKLSLFIDMIKGISSVTGNLIVLDEATSSVDRTFNMLSGTLKEVIEGFEILGSSILSRLSGLFSAITDRIKTFVSYIKNAANSIFTLENIISATSLGGIILVFTRLANAIIKPADLLDDFTRIAKFGLKNAIGNLNYSLKELGNTLKVFQAAVTADALLKIGKALLMLAGALMILSLLPEDRMASSTFAIATLGAILVFVFKSIGSLEFGKGMLDFIKLPAMLLAFSSSMLLLAGAMAIMGTLKPEQMAASVIAIGVLLQAMSVLVKEMSSVEPTRLTKGLSGFIAMAVAIRILANAAKAFASLPMDGLLKGMGSILALIGAFAFFTKFSDLQGSMISTGLGILALSVGIKILAGAVKDLSDIPMDNLISGLTAVGSILVGLAVFIFAIPEQKLLGAGVALLAISIGVRLIATALESLSKIPMESMGAGIAGLAGILMTLAIAVNIMQANMKGAATILIVAVALGVLVGVLKQITEIEPEKIGKGIISLALALGVLLVATTSMQAAIGGAFSILIVASALTILSIAIKNLAEISAMDMIVIVSGIAAMLGVIGLMAPLLMEVAVPLITAGVALSVFGAGLTVVSLGLKAFGEAFPIFMKGLADAIPDLDKFGQWLIDGLVKGITVFGHGLEDAARFIGKTLINAVKAIFGIASPSKVFMGIGKNIVQGLINGLKNMISKLPGIATSMLTALVKGLKNLPGKLHDLATTGIGKFVSGLGSKIKDVSSKSDAIADAVKNKIKNVGSGFYGIGRNAVQGLINGMSSLLGRVGSIATAIGNKVKSAIKAKKSLDQHSPSRAMFKIGEFAIQGFINGLDAMASGAEKSASNVGKGVVKRLNDSLSKITSITEDSLDIPDPQITPALDISKIQNGMKDIDSMFSKRQAFAIDANFNGQTTDNTLLSALEKGFADIINKFDDIPDPSVSVNVPLEIDGRTLARSQATLNEEEISRIQFHENRKLGIV